MPDPWAALIGATAKLLARLGPGGTSYNPCSLHEIRRRNNPFTQDVVLTHHTPDGDITLKRVEWERDEADKP